MKGSAIFRSALAVFAFSLGLSLAGISALGQDVGADVGGGAGIFRAKNPEAKKRTVRTTPTSRRGGTRTNAASSGAEDRIEE